MAVQAADPLVVYSSYVERDSKNKVQGEAPYARWDAGPVYYD